MAGSTYSRYYQSARNQGMSASAARKHAREKAAAAKRNTNKIPGAKTHNKGIRKKSTIAGRFLNG